MTDLRTILDLAAQSAVVARADRTPRGERIDKSQIMRLLELFESRVDLGVYDRVQVLKAFVLRQVQRGELGRNTARVLIEALSRVCPDVNRCDERSVRDFLTLFRWLFDAIEICGMNLPQKHPVSFHSLIEHIVNSCMRR